MHPVPWGFPLTYRLKARTIAIRRCLTLQPLGCQRSPREESGRSHRFTGRFGFALGEIYGPDRKFGLWGRSGGWHILQGRKDSRWTAVQNAAYGQLRYALIMGVGHMQTSVAAAARRMWVATVDFGALWCGRCGLDSDESGCPRRAWAARGHQQRSGPPQDTAALQGAVGGSGDGRRAGELIFGPAVPSTRRHNWYFMAATPGGRLSTRSLRGRLSSCWLCQLTALDHGGGLSSTRRGVGEWAGRSRGNEG